MKIIYNKFLIISTALILVGSGYLYLSKDVDSEGVIPVAFGSSLASVPLGNEEDLYGSESSSSSDGGKISSDIAFLSTLVSLKRIKVDTTIFKNESFKILKNNAVEIKPVETGRKNPFAKIVADKTINVVVDSDNVVTEEPSQITNNSVILNGTVNVTTGVTDLYFEYGATENLGTTTSLVEQSLVGTFVKSILGLTTKTNYFYKACAKINNVASCGDVVSFTTN